MVYFKGFSINKYLPSWADESAYQQLLCYQLSSFQLISRHGLELLEKSAKVGSSKVCKTWLGSDGKSILLLHCWFLFWLVFQWEDFSIFCYLYFLSCISFLRERGGEGMAVLLGHKGCLLCPCCHGCPIQINGKAPIGYRKATISWPYCDLCCTSVYLTPEDGKKHSQGVSKVPITVAVLCPSSQQSPLLSLLIGSSSWSKSSATPESLFQWTMRASSFHLPEIVPPSLPGHLWTKQNCPPCTSKDKWIKKILNWKKWQGQSI